MWVCLDMDGQEVYRHQDWKMAVGWAMKHGGEFAIAWLPSWGDGGVAA